MLTLTFNTTKKTVKLYNSLEIGESSCIKSLENVPTVKMEEGYYEVFQKDEAGLNLPVLRVPISNTIMHISK